MPITRTLGTDDDGSGTTGTIVNTAWKTELYNQIDDALLDPSVQNASTVIARTDSGTVHNWAPGIAGNTVILWAGSGDLTITGFAGGVEGQLVTIRNGAGAGVLVHLAHALTGSSAQALFNLATSAPTRIAPGGWATYMFSASFGLWLLVGHEQGAWITPPFNAANFVGSGGLNWGVTAGQIEMYRYRLSGKTLSVSIGILGSTLSGSPASILAVILPGGYTVPVVHRSTCFNTSSAGAAYQLGQWNTANNQIQIYPTITTTVNWAIGTFHLFGVHLIGEVT